MQENPKRKSSPTPLETVEKISKLAAESSDEMTADIFDPEFATTSTAIKSEYSRSSRVRLLESRHAQVLDRLLKVSKTQRSYLKMLKTVLYLHSPIPTLPYYSQRVSGRVA